MRTEEWEGADGLRIATDLWGDGPPQTLLLHGGGQTRGAWGRTGEHLAGRGVPTAAVDLRGHGGSGWDPRGRYAFPDHARDVRAVLEGCSRPAVLIGASLGGVISLKVALDDPGAVRAVVLVDIAPTMQLSGVDRIVGFMRANPDGFETLEQAREAVAAYQPHRKRPPGGPAGPGGSGLTKNLRRAGETGRWMWHWDPRTLNFATPDWFRKQTRDMTGGVTALGEAGVPVLLVRGELSDVIVPADVERFLALGPHTREVTVAGARHMVAGDENEVFFATILSALSPHVPQLRGRA